MGGGGGSSRLVWLHSWYTCYAANLLYKCIPSIGSDLQGKLTRLQQLLNLCCYCLGTDRFAYKYHLLCQSLRGQYSVGWTHGESLTVSYQERITNALAVTFKFFHYVCIQALAIWLWFTATSELLFSSICAPGYTSIGHWLLTS